MLTGAAAYTPVGYQMCACGAVFPKGTRRTGRCEECDRRVALGGEPEVVVRIGDESVVRRPRPKRKRRRARPTAATKQARRTWNRARSRALSELARRHPEEYAALLEHHHREAQAEESAAH